MSNGKLTILQGDVRETLKTVASDSVQCVVTSPPYWGLRDYGVTGQLGLESTPQEYVANMVAVFEEVRRVLREDGTLWLNLGDSYANDGKWGGETGGKQAYLPDNDRKRVGREKRFTGLKPKDLVGIPWRVAFALQAAGWYLRQDIIWHKPAPMPESVRDRCTKAHEYLFLLTKSPKYYYDKDAIAEECVAGDRGSSFLDPRDEATKPNLGTAPRKQCFPAGWATGKDHSAIAHQTEKQHRKVNGGACFGKQSHDSSGTGAQQRTYDRPIYDKRNKRGVWSVQDDVVLDWLANQPEGEALIERYLSEAANKSSVWRVAAKGYKGAHFATFPPKLIEPCILAGSKPGDLVLDPFGGTGTVAQVALLMGRRALLCELNPKYNDLIHERLGKSCPLLVGA